MRAARPSLLQRTPNIAFSKVTLALKEKDMFRVAPYALLRPQPRGTLDLFGTQKHSKNGSCASKHTLNIILLTYLLTYMAQRGTLEKANGKKAHGHQKEKQDIVKHWW